jgi:hypothetical protein
MLIDAKIVTFYCAIKTSLVYIFWGISIMYPYLSISKPVYASHPTDIILNKSKNNDY